MLFRHSTIFCLISSVARMISFIRKNFTALSISTLLTTLAVGCSKDSPSPDGSKLAAAAKPSIIDLGTLELSDNKPMQIELTEGRTAVVTTKVLPDGSLDIGTVIQAPPVDGRRKLLGMPRVITKPGRVVEVMVGEVGLKFTPRVKSNNSRCGKKLFDRICRSHRIGNGGRVLRPSSCLYSRILLRTDFQLHPQFAFANIEA
jgi:hypothetical protein